MWRFIEIRKISFTKLIGTVVAERLVDMISLLILLGLVFFSQFGKMLNFIKQNPEFKEKLYAVFTSPYLIVGVILLFILFLVFRNALKHTAIFKKLSISSIISKKDLFQSAQ